MSVYVFSALMIAMAFGYLTMFLQSMWCLFLADDLFDEGHYVAAESLTHMSTVEYEFSCDAVH